MWLPSDTSSDMLCNPAPLIQNHSWGTARGDFLFASREQGSQDSVAMLLSILFEFFYQGCTNYSYLPYL